MNTAIITLVYREPNIIKTMDSWHSAMPEIPIYIFADGVDDETESDLQYLSLSKTINLPVTPSKVRKGYPRAMRDAILWMRNNTNYDRLLITDSDGCYATKDMANLIQSGIEIYGYRAHRREKPFRMFYIKMEKYIMRFLFDVHMDDPTAVCMTINLSKAAGVSLFCHDSKFSFWLEFQAYYRYFFGRPNEMSVDYVSQPSKIYALHKMPRILVTEILALLRVRRHIVKLRGTG